MTTALTTAKLICLITGGSYLLSAVLLIAARVKSHPLPGVGHRRLGRHRVGGRIVAAARSRR